MGFCRMDIINKEPDDSKIEEAHYVMLSLYREYSIMMLKNPVKKEEYIIKMKQIKNDIRYLNKKELVEKAEMVYKKILQKARRENTTVYQ